MKTIEIRIKKEHIYLAIVLVFAGIIIGLSIKHNLLVANYNNIVADLNACKASLPLTWGL